MWHIIIDQFVTLWHIQRVSRRRVCRLHAGPAFTREGRSLLIERLWDAEAGHDASICTSRHGVSRIELAEDLSRWRTLGAAIVQLAR